MAAYKDEQRETGMYCFIITTGRVRAAGKSKEVSKPKEKGLLESWNLA